MFESGALLLGAAEAGNLRVNPDEANAAVQKLAAVRDNLQVLFNTMRQGGYGEKLQLGANPVGRAMSEKSTSKASGDESLHAAVESLLTQATNAHDAVKRAMENYDYTDDAGARRFRPQH